jgi:cell division protein FtsZ
VTSAADQNANVIFGAVIDGAAKDEVRVTVIATGFGPARLRRHRPVTERAEIPVPRERERERREPAETPDEIEIPSFLRD